MKEPWKDDIFIQRHHLDRIRKDLTKRVHLASYQMAIVMDYMAWCYAVGFEEGIGWHGRAQAVVQIKDGKIMGFYKGTRAAARSVRGSRSMISRAIHLGKTYRDSHWKYSNTSNININSE